ncbi:unnamed protein product [Larinioides sclopetarius]|uniref:Orn/DAP/Arg decarboxylase 2 N-terminal domain-containing protein n=1 Tax=Larinioides sclopetarius TaxID=280406 RepID=A0AAV2ANB6_9ARAC
MDPDMAADIVKFCKMADQKDEDSAFLIFDIDDVIKKVNYWKEKMPRINPFYAMKCNSDPMLLQTLAALNVGFDCASKMEIETIINLGVPADRIVYANTCKGFSHIRRAAELKVELMTFDSEHELLKIKQLSPTAKLLLRLKIIGKSSKISMNCKFGCDDTEVPRLLEATLQHNLSVIGVSFHVGSDIHDPDDFVTAIKTCRRVFDIAEKKGIRMYMLDIGGGFTGVISTRNCARKSNFDEISEAVNQSIDEHFQPYTAFKIIAEPGRYFATTAFTLCSKIIGKRQRTVDNEEDTMYIINEGVYGHFVFTVFHHFKPAVKDMWPNLKDKKRSSIWGQSCDPADLIVKKCMLPELKVGDWIVFEEMGAYTSACATNFNGFEKTGVKHVVSKKALGDLENVLDSKFAAVYLKESDKKIK